MSSSRVLDMFGAFISRSLRDRALQRAEGVIDGRLKSPALADLQVFSRSLPPEQRTLLGELVRDAVDAGIHDFLFQMQAHPGNAASIVILVDGQDVAKASDSLHGEIFGDQGWFARFSSFPPG